MKKIIIALACVTFLGVGCDRKESQNSFPSQQAAPTEDVVQTIATTTIYTVQDLNLRLPTSFSFDSQNLSYGRKLATFKNGSIHATLYVEPTADAPIKPIAEGDTEIRTQNELKKTEENLPKDTTEPLLSTRYDVPGAAFYKQAEWSWKNTIYTLRFSLSEPVPTGTWNKELQNKIDTQIKDIDNGNVGVNVKEELNLFNIIISSVLLK